MFVVTISLGMLLLLCSRTISEVDAATAQSHWRATRHTLRASHGRAQASAFADLAPRVRVGCAEPGDEFVYRPLVRFSTREWTYLRVECGSVWGFLPIRRVDGSACRARGAAVLPGDTTFVTTGMGFVF